MNNFRRTFSGLLLLNVNFELTWIYSRVCFVLMLLFRFQHFHAFPIINVDQNHATINDCPTWNRSQVPSAAKRLLTHVLGERKLSQNRLELPFTPGFYWSKQPTIQYARGKTCFGAGNWLASVSSFAQQMHCRKNFAKDELLYTDLASVSRKRRASLSSQIRRKFDKRISVVIVVPSNYTLVLGTNTARVAWVWHRVVRFPARVPRVHILHQPNFQVNIDISSTYTIIRRERKIDPCGTRNESWSH